MASHQRRRNRRFWRVLASPGQVTGGAAQADALLLLRPPDRTHLHAGGGHRLAMKNGGEQLTFGVRNCVRRPDDPKGRREEGAALQTPNINKC